MSAVEILREARALIADKRRWTQGTNARDASGASIPASSEQAICFCASGALDKCATSDVGRLAACEALDDASHLLFGDGDFVSINDDFGHSFIIEAFDKAIEIAEAEAANA